jgi:alginate O-acetyltransferase complex protein AlgI
MLFNSLDFLLFFPVVAAVHFLCPARFRWLWLLFASCVFYMAFIPKYILILAFTIVIDYTVGILIGQASGKRRLALLWVSIAANLSILGVFKYFNFVNDNIRVLASALHWNYSAEALAIALPIGLSFHIFQSLAYVIEVYRGNQVPERHFGIYALYVMFFPQLVAGPIERPQNLLHQFHEDMAFDYDRVVRGLRWMVWGFLLKLVVADRLALIVNPIYDHPHQFTGIPLIVATLAFSFQIFCDFAGYSTIALGTAEVLGVRLMENFRSPYLSTSIAEFWTRWHISLSTWFRDYLYIPLGGSRVTRVRHCLNVAIVFLVSGLWHGAAWNYVIWGALHASYMVGAIVTSGWRGALAARLGLGRFPTACRLASIATTFTLVSFAWIFFRAATFADASYIVTHLFTGVPGQLAHAGQLLASFASVAIAPRQLFLAATFVALLVTIQALHPAKWLERQPGATRWLAYQAAMATLLLFGVFKAHSSFIYFQF